MATTSTGRTSWRTRLVAAATAVIVALGVAACGDDGGGEKLTTAQVNAAVASALKNLQEGRIDAAKEGFEKVLDSDGENKFAHYNLGYIAQTQGDLGEAEDQYRAALKTDPRFAAALYNLAIVVTPDDAEEALDLYRQAIEANPNDANAHYNLGLLLRKRGKTAEGNAQIQQAVQLNPDLAGKAAAQGVPAR
jgi:Tfp pilus assembly protein PilF